MADKDIAIQEMAKTMDQELAESMPYRDYLLTEHWQEFRRVALKHHGKKCKVCGSKRFLHVHHLSYDNLGNESVDDVEILCRYCHEEYHGIISCNHPVKAKGTIEVGMDVIFVWCCPVCRMIIEDREPSTKELKAKRLRGKTVRTLRENPESQNVS